MSSKSGPTKRILKILAEKPAVAVPTIKASADPKVNYALDRALKNLAESGYVEIRQSENENYARLTKKGRARLNELRLSGGDALVPHSWDGFWRIIIIDLPEERKSEREALRYLLKKAGFVCIKNTVWISIYPYEHLFTNIKKDLGLSTELMIVVTDKLDEETRKAFLESITK